jgi:mannose-6-phosphate isomerase-like protein (cupin superfamily)
MCTLYLLFYRLHKKAIAMQQDPCSSLIASIRSAQIIIGCTNLSESISFLTSKLGFKVRMIMPSDAPSVAVLSGHGCHFRLETVLTATPMRLRLLCDLTKLPDNTASNLHGPDGLTVEIVDAQPALEIPAGVEEFVLTRMAGPESWGIGRAGMLYRDLIPSRLGGRFVASHICIPKGGPVPDYVHYHKVRFQMIFCKTGWVRLVYEDQGEPFILHAGDCVLQPPEIRHRVLEASDGLEVIEIGCPAIHETFGDSEMPLPTGANLPDRDYQKQKFIRHSALGAVWQESRLAGFETRDTGIAQATQGLAGVRILRRDIAKALSKTEDAISTRHKAEFVFFFVLKGSAKLHSEALGEYLLKVNDCCVLPSNSDYFFTSSEDLEMLEVSLPGVLTEF